MNGHAVQSVSAIACPQRARRLQSTLPSRPTSTAHCSRRRPTSRTARRRSARPPANTRGFTLIEIMVVIGIIAIITAIGIPPFVRRANRESLNQAVSDVLEACNVARSQAILKGAPMEIVFRASDGHIAVRPAKMDTNKPFVSGSAPDVVAPEEAAAGEIKGFNFDQDIMILMLDVNMLDQMQAPTARVRFYPNGTSDELTLVLQTPKGGTRKITLEVVTALADVETMR